MGKSVTVLRLTTNNALYFEANVSELEATRLHSELPVTLTVDALQGNRSNLYGAAQRPYPLGTVEKVVPVVDASTRNFIVRVRVQRSAQLFPGMFARGSIIARAPARGRHSQRCHGAGSEQTSLWPPRQGP